MSEKNEVTPETKKSKWKIIVPIIIAAIIVAVVITVCIVWNGKKGDTTATSETTPTPATVTTASPKPTPVSHVGQVRSNITGKWISKKAAKQRPFAIMVNNIGYANAHQRGTSNADILYEALAEGGITRMMALFQDASKVKDIGSVRSARHYYVSFASEWDAIYCHFGQTSYAISKIAQLKMDTLSGLSAIGPVVYSRYSGYTPPHNVYATGKKMLKGAKKLKYRKTVDPDKQATHFKFNDKDSDLKEGKVSKLSKITLPFSTYSTTYFKYNKSKKVYEKFEYNRKHMDTESNTQLAFKNLIVQFVIESNIDRNGYQHMKLFKKRGTGYYITNGKMIPIEWSKSELDYRMCYYDKKGNVLKINPGKTYIAAFPTKEKKMISIKK